MANVAETRVKITLQDAMSGNLRSIQGNLATTTSAVNKLESSFGRLTLAGASVASGAFGFYGVADVIDTAIGKAIEFGKSLETETIGMSGILTSMVNVEGQTLAWNDALNISKGIMRDLNIEALKTSATSQELISTFRGLLGPGLGGGMTIEQIKQFTVVGVNAVKSMGLEGRQLIQELRDLVQGGIQPASSTLATALGLRDRDIAAARNSSEGLFKFLMDRIAGFQKAAEATPETLRGMEDQLKEGLILSLNEGLKPVMEEYKDVLQSGIDIVLDTKNFTLNPQFITDVQDVSRHVVNMWNGFENIVGTVNDIAGPALSKFGTGLGLAADNVDKIAYGFAAWKIGSIATDIYRVTTNTNGAYEAQTLLGQAVKATGDYWNSSRNAGLQAAQVGMQAADQAAAIVMQAESKKQAAMKQTQLVEKGVAKLLLSGNAQLAFQLDTAASYYRNLGFSAEQAAKLQYQAAKQAAKGQADLAAQILNAQEKHLLAAQATANHTETLGKWYSRVNTAAGAVGGLSSAVMLLTDDTDSLAYSLANTGLAISSSVFAISTLIEQLGNLATAYKDVQIAGTAAGVLKAAGVVGASAIGIGATVGLGAAGIYAATHDLSMEDMWERWTFSKEDYEKQAADERIAFKKQEEEFARQQKQADILAKAAELAGNVEPKFPREERSTGGRGSRAADKALKDYEKNVRAMNDLSAELERKILEDTGSTFEVQMAKLDEELQKMQSKVEKAALAGVDVSTITQQLEQYRAEEERKINREKYIDLNQMRMDFIQAEEEANLISAQRADELRIEQLTSYKDYLQQTLLEEGLTLEQRLQLQQEYAQAVTDLQQAQSTEWQDAWSAAMNHLKDTQFDQLQTLENGWDSITSSITNFGQNMLTEQKSFSERCKDLYNDLANSIMNTMMKVIMQGLVMKSIMGIFGMGGDEFHVDANGISYQKLGGSIVSSVPSSQLKFNADGGYAHGWSIVGERGPELVNFEQPGRVYNAEQTARALKGSSSPENMKIVIENRSGTPVKATGATSSFNGKEYVLSIVVDAVSTNEGGITDILKGAVGNY